MAKKIDDKKETKKDVPKLIDHKKNLYIMDPANVALIMRTPNYVDADGFECDLGIYKLTNWDSVKSSIHNPAKLEGKTTKFTKEYCDTFVKTVKAWYNSKSVKLSSCSLYENVKKDLPCIIFYDSMLMVLAPRVDND